MSDGNENSESLDGVMDLLSMFNNLLGQTGTKVANHSRIDSDQDSDPCRSAKIDAALFSQNNHSNMSAPQTQLPHNKCEVNFKRLHEDAKLPTKGTLGSAGLDLYALEDTLLCGRITYEKYVWSVNKIKQYSDITNTESNTEISRGCPIRTGISLEIPPGYVGLINDRSSLVVKHKIMKAAGVIDSDYRGELLVFLYNHSDEDKVIEKGERFAQLLIMPVLDVVVNEVSELSDTVRGDGKFGHTGKY